jgi:hypothetical protein
MPVGGPSPAPVALPPPTATGAQPATGTPPAVASFPPVEANPFAPPQFIGQPQQPPQTPSGLHMIGGVDLLILRPHFSSNPALTQVSQTTTPGTPTQINQSFETRDFNYGYNVTPRFWLGIEINDGLGLRTRWFRYDQDADRRTGVAGVSPSGTTTSFNSTIGGIATSPTTIDPRTSAPLSSGDRLEAKTGLFLDVHDLEVTRTYRSGSWVLMAGGGVRYAFLEQTYSVNRPGVATLVQQGPRTFTGSFQSDTLNSRQTFTGAGPLASLDVFNRLGDSNIALFGSLRGAVLFGEGKTHSTMGSLATTTTGASTAGVQTTTSTRSSGWDVLPVAEMELGLYYGLPVGNAELFLKPSLVGQVYLDGGNSASRLGDLGLFGANVTFGLGF